MTLTLELTPEAEEKLRLKAARRGQKLDEYAQAVLLTDADTLAAEDSRPAPAESVYDDLQDYIEMFKGGEQTSYSENTGAKFAEAMWEKHQQSRL